MKKTRALLLVLLLLFSYLTGCSTQKLPSQSAEPDTSLAEEPETPVAPSEESVSPADLLSNKEAMDAGGVLWQVPCTILEEQDYQDLYLVGDKLLLSRITYDGDPYSDFSARTLHLAMLSLETGDVLSETTLAGLSFPNIQICGSKIAVYDWEVGKYYVLDDSLAVLQQTETELLPYGSCFSADASAIYQLTTDSGILKTELSTGEETVYLDHLRDIFTSTICDTTQSFSCVDLSTQFTTYGALDLQAGDIRFFPYDGTFYSISCRDNIWLASVPGDENIILVGFGDEAHYLDLNTGYARLFAAGDDTRLLVNRGTAQGDLSMHLFDLNGSFLSSVAHPLFRDSYCTEPVWSDRYGGCFFTVTTYDGETRLMFWDCSVQMLGENLPKTALAPAEPVTGTAVSLDLYEKAAALSEQYGLNIRIADLCETDYYAYTTAQQLDEQTISQALSLLEDTFALYPSGMIGQLKFDTYREIEINLCGDLTAKDLPEDANGFTSFIAFVEMHEDKIVMVLNTNEGIAMKQHIFHEFSHIIDKKLEFDARYREDALYSEESWAAFNPAEFSYEMNYHTLSENIYQDGYDAWFIDTYARTFPTEDRARIMECAMMGYRFPFISEGPLRDKLDYYARCIRDGFDTTGWPEITLWEQALYQ